MKLERIVVQAFRGYPNRVEVLFSGDVVLFLAANGSGKTSLTEAFEWALYGTIVRKSRSKSPSEYKGWGWLRSAHADDSVATIVEVELIDASGNRHVVERRLIGNDAELTVDGRAAGDVRQLGIQTGDAFRPFLGQCEIQALIDSEQQDRWQQLSAILGFGEFSELRLRLQRMRTDTDHQARVQAVRETATRVIHPLAAQGEDPLSVNPEVLRERTATYLALSADASWAAIKSESEIQINSIYSRDGGRSRPDNVLSSLAVDVRPTATKAADAIKTVLAEITEHRNWHARNVQAQFAELGLRLAEQLPSGECPFCGHKTLTEDRLVKIRATVAPTATPPRDSRQILSSAIVELRAPGPTSRADLQRLIDVLVSDPDRQLLNDAITALDSLEDARSVLVGLHEGFQAATEIARLPTGDADALTNLGSQLTDAVERTGERYQRARASGELVREALARRFAGLTPDEQKRVAGLQVAKSLGDNAPAVLAAWRVRTLQGHLAETTRRLEDLEKREMSKALHVLSADIARYYEELSPGHHITITGVTVRDSRYRQAALEATSYGRVVNPVTTFSEAEGNCLGLSLYFSQRVDRNPEWQMILLDDPVQSMDEGHEQGLVNLLARVSRNRQVIVMTHDRRFGEAVDAQFAAIPGYVRYNINHGSGPEPHIELAAGRLDELLTYAESNAGGDRTLRESCAGAIRKAVERFSRDLSSRAGPSLQKGMKVETMVERLHERRLIDDLEVGTLHRLRRFGSRAAHEDPDVNASEAAIRTSVKALRELQGKYLAVAPKFEILQGGAGDGKTG